jgi:peptidoglycan/xylan/chitin deacetylase (PgdA/CDA1 family)
VKQGQRRAARIELFLAFLPGISLVGYHDTAAVLPVHPPFNSTFRCCTAPISLYARAFFNPSASLEVRTLKTLKQLLLSGLTSDLGLKLSAPLRPVCASVIFMHRFAVPELGVTGHDPAILAAQLEYLRRRRYRLMSVADLIRHIDEDIPVEQNALVFTVDDGYADFIEAGAPVFAAYDCPVTVFVVTDFVSGKLWNWFDRVEWAFVNSPRTGLSISVGTGSVAVTWSSVSDRVDAAERMVEALKRVPDADKESLLRQIEKELDVAIPVSVPEKYRPMTWDQIRRSAHNAVTIGPHTVTHPILSQVDENRADYEIAESWRAVAAQTEAAVPVFCYPNGTARDFSARDENSVARAGMKAAFSTMDGSLESSASCVRVDDLFAIPRFAYSEHPAAFIQVASGLEQRKTRIRR